MDHLWSPWRMDYILSPKPKTCVFCDKISLGNDRKEHILLRGQTAFIALNRYPYNNGHLLIIPYAHVASLEDLSADTLQEMMLLVNKGLSILRLSMQPDGFNLGANLGKLAGAGVEDHVHLHLVPRWSADTNFMTTVSDTRTIPEMLEQTFSRLTKALETLSG